MKPFDLLITVASWEDRFRLGFDRVMAERKVKRALIYYYAEYADRTARNREYAKDICGDKTKPIETSISFGNALQTWKQLTSDVEELNHANVLLDISTMPRDTILNLLLLLDGRKNSISYVYHKPERYSSEWLSRDPGRPRLLFKQSGVTKLGCKTILLVITGFDAERTEQLITTFEPKQTILGIQTGGQFENNRLNLEKHRGVPSAGSHPVKFFDLDAYSNDHGLEAILREIEPLKNEHNIILSSLGPKPSAIALYRARGRFPEMALAYAPSNDFNMNYSNGIGRSLWGTLPPNEHQQQ
jgi:hypothetical protein